MSHRMIVAAFALGLIGAAPVATAVELNPKAIAIRQADQFSGATPPAPPPSTRWCCSAIRPSPASTW